MTEKEKRLIGAAHEMSCNEIDELFQKFRNNSSEEFKQELVNILAKKTFTDDWWENEIDFEDALMELDPEYRESLINEDWRELLDK